MGNDNGLFVHLTFDDYDYDCYDDNQLTMNSVDWL